MSNSFFENKLAELFSEPTQLASNLDQLEQLLKTVAATYQAYLDRHYPDGKVFFMFQDVNKNDLIDLTLPASEIIRKAYPVVQFDAEGKALDNREQAYIDTVTQFINHLEERPISEYSQVDEEIYYATSVFAASSGLWETTRKLRNAMQEKDEDTIGCLANTCKEYGRQLEEALVASSPSVVKELELKDSWSGRIILQLQNLISAITAPFRKEEKPALLAEAGCYLGEEQSVVYPTKRVTI